jgi:hypothetical protein
MDGGWLEYEDYNDEKLVRRWSPANPGYTPPRGQAKYRNETGCRVGRAEREKAIPQRDVMDAGGGEDTIQPRLFTSFFREYSVTYDRTKVEAIDEDDHKRDDLPVYCFGQYREYDTKTELSRPKDQHCIIDTDKGEDYDDMENSQEGKGEYEPLEDFDDPPVDDPDRDEDGKDVWVQDTGNALSLLDGEELKEELENDLTIPLLNLDHARQRATVQMSTEKPLSSGALLRAFDDTVAFDDENAEDATNPKHTIVEWCQEIETMMHTAFTPPVVRLKLPPAWSVDLDPLHPLLTPVLPDTEDPNRRENPLLQPIDVQLEIREDLLGEVATYLEDSLLLRIEEEPIPVVVPLGSPTEFRTLAAGWCYWHKIQEDTADCSGLEIVEDLQKLATRVEEYRTLRAELSLYLAEYLKMHNEINKEIGEWVLENAEKFFEEREDTEDMDRAMEKWQEVQQVYRNFHDKTNMPWCRNDALTTPIYSLLDSWMPGRPDLTGEELPRLADTLEEFVDEYRKPDLVLDFTDIHVSTGAVVVPVLKPVQLHYDLKKLRPPSEKKEDPDIPTIPELPPIPSICGESIPECDKLTDRVPKVDKDDNLPEVYTPPDTDIPDLEAKLDEIKEVLEGMDEEYKKFWKGVLETESECPKPNDERCVHTEMDLHERFVRIAARPAVLLEFEEDKFEELKEDAETWPHFRRPEVHRFSSCEITDWSCPLLNPEEMEEEGWGLLTPPEEAQEEVIGEIHREAFEKSIQTEEEEEDRFPYVNEPGDILPSLNRAEHPKVQTIHEPPPDPDAS